MCLAKVNLAKFLVQKFSFEYFFLCCLNQLFLGDYMNEQVESIGERAKDVTDMHAFFNGLVQNNSLDAYDVIVDAQTVIEESAGHKLVWIDKGAKILKTNYLNFSHTFLRFPEIDALYYFNRHRGSRDAGCCATEGVIVDSCLLEKMVCNYDLRKVSRDGNMLVIPSDFIAGRLVLQKITSYDIFWRDCENRSYVYMPSNGKIFVSGERDAFFDKVIEFFKS